MLLLLLHPGPKSLHPWASLAAPALPAQAVLTLSLLFLTPEPQELPPACQPLGTTLPHSWSLAFFFVVICHVCLFQILVLNNKSYFDAVVPYFLSTSAPPVHQQG